MAKHAGGINSAPRGSTGGTTFQRGRPRRKSATISRAKPHPHQPVTTAQDTQRDKMREAVAIINLLPNALYKPAWNNNSPKRSAYQVLLSWLLNELTWTGTLWSLNYGMSPAQLGPSFSTPTVPVNIVAPTRMRIYLPSTTPGDHTAGADLLSGWILPRYDPGAPPDPTAVFTLINGFPRSGAEYISDSLYPGTTYQSVWWFRHVGSNGQHYYSPTMTAGLTMP